MVVHSSSQDAPLNTSILRHITVWVLRCSLLAWGAILYSDDDSLDDTVKRSIRLLFLLILEERAPKSDATTCASNLSPTFDFFFSYQISVFKSY